MAKNIFVVADIPFETAVITSSVAKIILVVAVIILEVAVITYSSCSG